MGIWSTCQPPVLGNLKMSFLTKDKLKHDITKIVLNNTISEKEGMVHSV